MFKSVDTKVNFSKQEEGILSFWNDQKIFQESLEQRKHSPLFYFYDGPPFATGLPHYGHILAGTIKDVIPRYKTMCGYYVERRFGWDCHGLPVEYEAEKELKLNGKYDIEKMGIDKFNEYCRSIVLRYSKEWKNTISRMARWADIENDYKTMDKDFMETIWWIFSTLYKKNLIYLSNKILAYSPRLSTPLSNFEVNLGYRLTKDPSIIVKFRLKKSPDTYFLAWTTTPWTLPTNAALTISKDLEYSLVSCENEKYYLASLLVDKVLAGKKYELLKKITASELEYEEYEPLFDYFDDPKFGKAFFVTIGEHVDSKTGTGIVHTSPLFGEDDFNIGKKYDLPQILPFTDTSEFDSSIPELQNLFFKDADPLIIKKLKAKGLILKHEQIEHSYPFCWRTELPLMYRAIPSWFLDVRKIKEQLLANNQKINWQPEHIKEGRMGKWLENARDWAISRNRFWGTPIPVWICSNCKQTLAISSIEELEERSKLKIQDLHRHYIDHIKLECPNCKQDMYRTPEVLDCWFESGSMPYGQKHYPFENKAEFEASFPADFISEGLDQTRGWFYTLLVLSNALFDKSAFKNCIVSGLILAEDGQKMSKRLKNYPNPSEMIDLYGADTIRLYMLNSAAIKADELKFSEQGLIDTLRSYIIPLWNVLNFFVTYANIDKWEAPSGEEFDKLELDLNHPLDLWILSRLTNLMKQMGTSLDNYNLNEAVEPLLTFVDELTNWYLRRSRRRFWKNEITKDKNQAYFTTYLVLINLSKLLAPFIPYLSDAIYRSLKTEVEPKSVHLCDYPKFKEQWNNSNLENTMDLAITACRLGRVIRNQHKIKIRQPLKSLTLFTKDKKIHQNLAMLESFILDELNVKTLYVLENEEELVDYYLKPNLPILGKKYGKHIPKIKEKLAKVNSAAIVDILKNDLSLNIDIDIEGDLSAIEIKKDELIISRTQKNNMASISENNFTLSIDLNIDEALKQEGLSREVLNRIQNYRKELNFKVNDKIDLKINAPEHFKKAILSNLEYIKIETLCNEIIFSQKADNSFTRYQIEDYVLYFSATVKN